MNDNCVFALCDNKKGSFSVLPGVNSVSDIWKESFDSSRVV